MYMPRNLHETAIQILWFMSECSVQCMYVRANGNRNLETTVPVFIFCFHATVDGTSTRKDNSEIL